MGWLPRSRLPSSSTTAAATCTSAIPQTWAAPGGGNASGWRASRHLRLPERGSRPHGARKQQRAPLGCSPGAAVLECSRASDLALPRCQLAAQSVGATANGRLLCVTSARSMTAQGRPIVERVFVPRLCRARPASDQVRTGAPPGTRTPNPRIKSLTGARSPGFMSVRAACQTACAYWGELGRTRVNCNPNCNPSPIP